jgi:hypothetical protein
MLILMKILPLGAELFQAGRRKDRKELIIASHSFTKVPKNDKKFIIVIFDKLSL